MVSIKASLFESKSCGRCGGSGRYSYNQMDGDRCFGCRGCGLVLTKRGAAARAFYDESLKKRAGDVVVGDQILESVGIAGPRRWHSVKEIRPSASGAVGVENFAFALWRKGRLQCHHICGLDSVVRSIRSQADLDAKIAAAQAYEKSLTKAGVLRANAKVAA